MKELPERAAAARTSLMGLVRLAPAAELAGISRRRRRRRRRRATVFAAAVAAAVVVVPMVPRSAPPTVADQPYPPLDHTITANGGTLVLSPPDPAAKPLIPSGQAEEVLPRLVLSGLGDKPADLYLAAVASPLADPYGAGAPLHRRLAWVLTTGFTPFATSCPPITVRPTAAPSPTIGLKALIIDALTGEAIVYRPALCPGVPPRLDKAYTGYSVPFQVRADGAVVPELPPCGERMAFELTGMGAAAEVRVLARVPVAPCGSPAPSPSPEGKLRVSPQVRHAPVGPLVDVGGELLLSPRPS